MTTLTFTSASQLAQMIRDRQVSAVEVLEAYLTQVTTHNETLNAICTLDDAKAQEQAKQADEALSRGENWGALHGVPVTIKDIFETAGLRTTAGYFPLKDYVPQQDATVVARLRSAGAIILGKTNPAELANDWQGVNSVFPRVHNPWNLNVTPGGSSSGSAAAIASGLSPLDIGDDFGGSIRQPSHFCGIYGLKPTDRRVPTTGHIPELPGARIKCLRHMLTVGPLTRSIKDLRLCLQIIAGPDGRQPDIPPVPLDMVSDRPLQDLKIAWADEFTPFPVDTQIKSTLQVVAKTLETAGAVVELWQPKFDFVAAWQIGMKVSVSDTVYAYPAADKNMMKRMAFMWREATQGDPTLRRLGNIPKMVLPIFLKSNLKDYFEILTQRDELITQMDNAIAPWDVCLAPVAMTCAYSHRPQGQAIAVNGRQVPYMMANGAYTGFFAMSGHPVVVIPVGQTQEGLPIGMQVIGKRWQEMELLAISQVLDDVIQGFRIPAGY